MRKVPNSEVKELIDHIISISMILHRSGISVAESLDLPEDIISQLRQRSIRNAMIGPCNCPECVD